MPVLTIPLRSVNLGDGHFMAATAEVDTDQGVATFTEQMTCTNKLAGFTGGVLLTYFDASNQVIGNSGVQQNGINQAPLFGANHRTVTWNGTSPAGVASFVLAQFWDPHNRAGDILTTIGEAFLTFAGGVIEGMLLTPLGGSLNEQWCAANPDLCKTMDAIGMVVGVGLEIFISA